MITHLPCRDCGDMDMRRPASSLAVWKYPGGVVGLTRSSVGPGQTRVARHRRSHCLTPVVSTRGAVRPIGAMGRTAGRCWAGRRGCPATATSRSTPSAPRRATLDMADPPGAAIAQLSADIVRVSSPHTATPRPGRGSTVVGSPLHRATCACAPTRRPGDTRRPVPSRVRVRGSGPGGARNRRGRRARRARDGCCNESCGMACLIP